MYVCVCVCVCLCARVSKEIDENLAIGCVPHFCNMIVHCTTSLPLVINIIRSGARFAAHSLLVQWISFVYLLHGRLLRAWYISPTM